MQQQQYTEYRTTGVMYSYGYMVCECDGCQAPVPCPPAADEWRKTGLSRGGTGEGPAWEVFLVESWRDVSVRMKHAIGPRENAFPTRSHPLWLSTSLEVDSKSLSQSIRFIDLVSR